MCWKLVIHDSSELKNSEQLAQKFHYFAGDCLNVLTISVIMLSESHAKVLKSEHLLTVSYRMMSRVHTLAEVSIVMGSLKKTLGGE